MISRGVFAIIGLAAVVLTGCSAGAANGDAYLNLSGDKVATEVFQAESISIMEHAKNVLQAECMDKRGYPQLKQSGMTQNDPPFSDLNDHGPQFAKLTEDEAGKIGFGEHRKPQKANVLSFDAGFDKAYEQCSTEAKRDIGAGYTEVIAAVSNLHNTIVDERENAMATEVERPQTISAMNEFLDCLDGKGFRQIKPGTRDLDHYGVGIATGKHEGTDSAPPKRVRGTVETIPATAQRRYLPTPEETRLAVASVQCAQRTRYGEKIAEQRLRVLRQVLAKHETEINELRPKLQEMARKAAQLVGR